MSLELGVNIDHVATLRQARYAHTPDAHNAEPCILEAAQIALDAGAAGITMHLREDRRHVQDADIERVRKETNARLNFEMGNTEEIVSIALKTAPHSVCLVPEHREEVTTEGGLDVVANRERVQETCQAMRDAGIRVSLFIDPEDDQIDEATELGVEMIELHTGAFANAEGDARAAELQRLVTGAQRAHAAGLQVNAGHGLTTKNVSTLFAVPHLVELNIGHHLIARSVVVGLKSAIEEMLAVMATYSKS